VELEAFPHLILAQVLMHLPQVCWIHHGQSQHPLSACKLDIHHQQNATAGALLWCIDLQTTFLLLLRRPL